MLKPTGVLFMQCDTEANAYLRLLLDAVFGRRNFVNEITAAARGSEKLSDAALAGEQRHDPHLRQDDEAQVESSYEPYESWPIWMRRR